MSVHKIPSIDRQMLRRAEKNITQWEKWEKLLESLYKSESSKSSDSDYNRYVSESGVRYDFSEELNKLLQKRLEESLKEDSIFSGINYNYFDPWDLLK
ncbi:MAG: hypothetical protein J1F04_04540 [Oscillospiraceae bacterium]|nr:hypothetical protein [Oscillospiraceae bacterium]